MTKYASLLASLLLLVLVPAGAAIAAKVPDHPIANIELGTHLDRITGIDFDPSRGLLVTAADDRTLRVWDADTGRLLKTIWVPRNQRKDGELYALAVEPRSGTAAVGGWTGFDWDKFMSIYLFDLDSGEMRQRIGGFDERITSLSYSNDGKKLAVALLNGRVLVLSVPEYKPVAESTLCTKTAYRVDFGPGNRLVTNCFDGIVRVYDDKLDLKAEREIQPGKLPGAVRFSPDGKHIAIGFFDSPGVHVVQTKNLATGYTPDTKAAGDMPLFAVDWSLDGRTLYAAGDLKRGGRYRIVRWDKAGKGTPVELDASGKRMLRLRALPGGAIAYTSMEHGVAALGADGAKRFDVKPAIVNHEWKQTLLRVSQNGNTVAFGLDADGKRFGVFSLDSRRFTATTRPDESLRAAITEHPQVGVTDWHLSYEPKINGQLIPLHAQQESHSLAIAADGKFFILGLDSELRAYEADGRPRWSVYPVSGPYTANLSGDGRVVVAGHQDGTIRWYRAEDGVEILALFPHGNGEDWVAWTPTGHYMSSPNGDRFIGWHLNNGPDRAADFYSAWQFERVLYRPDLVKQYVNRRGSLLSDGRGARSQGGKRGEDEFNVLDLRSSAPPAVSVKVIKKAAKGTATIEVTTSKRERQIREYMVYVNSIPVTPYRERVLSGDDRNGFRRSHEVPLFGTDNEIRVEVLTDRSLAVAQTYLQVSENSTTGFRPGNLYVLAVGVNEVREMPWGSLEYAAQDAEALVARLEKNAGTLFERVYTRVLSDTSGEEPTKANIERELTFLREAGPNDTVLLFLAAHGLSNDAGDYFMVPRDAKSSDVAALLRGTKSGVERRFGSLIRWDTFFETLRAASGRRLLLVDTCQAKKIKGNFDAGSLAKRSAAASFALLAASNEDESSQEYPPGGHGLFTYALLDGLDGAADIDRNGLVELSEAFGHAREFVQLNRIEKRVTQTPQLVAPRSLADIPLAVAQ